MSFFTRVCAASAVVTLAAFASSSAVAGAMSFYGTQGPNPNLNSPNPAIQSTPPTLADSAAAAFANFSGSSTLLGVGGFENGSNTFNWGTGSYTVGAGGTVIDGNFTDLTLGRYNMTPGLAPLPNGFPDFGKWVETSAGFDINFSSAITAFGFFATDLGDFEGVFSVEYFSGQTQVYSTGRLTNQSSGAGGPNDKNGNLAFLGAVVDGGFDRISISVTQCSTNPQSPFYTPGCNGIDVVGFDGMIIASANTGGGTTPEPGSLALAGLALVAAGGAARRRQRR
jgi:hypothetical protein